MDDTVRALCAGRDASATELPGAVAEELFGAELPLARRFAELLAADGVAHGHLGPRELPRLWSRHLINCAVVGDLLPPGAAVLDVGSGAGLPGLPIAIRRPDVTMTLLEPMQRRSEFLTRCVDDLELSDRVTVVRGRVEDRATGTALGRQTWITARAVAPLARLVRWCVPLLTREGRLLAVKGHTAEAEVERDRDVVARLGAEVRAVLELGAADDATRVVVVGRRRRTVDGRVDERGGR